MDMDEPLCPSPASSSASDSDAYNTESARIYFGPLKTPERNFVAASKHLFPPPTASPLRRSPRRSSPRPTWVTPADPQEDFEDMQQVDQLINQENDEDDGVPDSTPDTPPNVENFLDEPSSALAEKIIHALDNPSPPPSPPPTLSLFDPYHATVPESSTDYQADLMSLSINDNTERDFANPLPIFSLAPLPTTVPPFNAIPEQPTGSAAVQQDLIVFDSFSTPLRSEALANGVAPPSTLSVDDLLSQSPGTFDLSTPRPPVDLPLVIVETSENDKQDVGSPMAVDKDQPCSDEKSDQPTLSSEGQERGNVQGESVHIQETQATLTPGPIATPLRRSTRPRKSVTPNITPNSPEARPMLAAPPSSARTQVKKRIKSFEPNDEVVNDSQDEGEIFRASPSPMPAVVRVRHRSPGKASPSFQRELGSLSPTSSTVLAGLAFTSADESRSDNQAKLPDQEGTSNSQPMFSFSVFTPYSDSAGPSTPLRPTGPVRIASPTKVTSPAKFRIQTPALNDPTNTPARRIPISEAIAQGHISPQKAIQLGFKPNGTPLPSVATPARRVLVSEASAPSTSKSNLLRYASPVKNLPSKKWVSVQTVHKVVESVKGKEKASQSSSAIVTELPYPLVPLSSTTPSAETSSAQAAAHDAVMSKPSPAKPGLKQVTSRIPRIGRKPYARPADPKPGEKARGTNYRLVDQVKVRQTSQVYKDDTNRRLFPWKPPLSSSTSDHPPTVSSRDVRVEAAKIDGGSTVRAKPNVSTSTTLLKRKREADRNSPVKPRVIMLRQVPVVPPASEPPRATAAPVISLPSKGKKSSTGPIRFRRVIDPEPPVQPQPPPASQPPPPEPELELPTIVCKPRPATPEQPISRESPQHAHIHTDKFSPASPMKQDSSSSSHVLSEPSLRDEPSNSIPAPVIIIDEPTTADPPMAGLRRTTRSRRTTIMQDGSSEPVPRSNTSRRKPPSFRSDDVFSGMSITALKDLTTSNTFRNQKYLAAKLETEVIRKEGIRPESPAVKIKTIVQREQEDKDRQRAERAMRRARRSDEMPSSDIEGAMDVGYSSAVEDASSDNEAIIIRHRRGAGDEDDYVTPDRPAFNIKPMRFGDDDMQGVEEQPKRRVKWDRGLFTTVYLDEVKLGSRQTLKENRSLKGILAPTAKALRLDTLGNLQHADSPLTELIQENITVKKIVYDSDVAAAAPEIMVKSTRSKGKKR
ncbi:hypothetical protein CPB84DRAFT_1846516 [Gymnopilus junonius]|uniref:Uncharacterized protein n=1 Tax=Gymnopilus junonius TaxID=109634 RepID=A0A9P5TMV0_GYMJU|nr:hypothetical protein CPB84DRAFT_1846516 [Gymnopilus junonius]